MLEVKDVARALISTLLFAGLVGFLIGGWVSGPDLNLEGHWPCMEDEVLQGHGQYEDGEWDYWSCIPADDL
jgi:hypothetical protein